MTYMFIQITKILYLLCIFMTAITIVILIITPVSFNSLVRQLSFQFKTNNYYLSTTEPFNLIHRYFNAKNG